ncbi:hypothetical protein ACJRO7_001335 [Eucalyptus globulus]|uniref:Uncharacterized protein n=1 Tax=Eucalyptus globulus TaxID=34317 RepID=A0ABD3LTV0_EUCGL
MRASSSNNCRLYHCQCLSFSRGSQQAEDTMNMHDATTATTAVLLVHCICTKPLALVSRLNQQLQSYCHPYQTLALYLSRMTHTKHKPAIAAANLAATTEFKAINSNKERDGQPISEQMLVT